MQMPFRTGNMKIKSALTLAKNHCMHSYCPKFANKLFDEDKGPEKNDF
jgi:hypothetical protein